MTPAEIILKKALVASKLDSSQWNQVQAAFRNRAFFSSQVVQANILQGIRQRVSEYAARGGGDISEARKLMREDLARMHYEPEQGKEGTIKDLFSKARLNVILKTNLAQTRGMIQRASGMTPGFFAAFPAQEFTRTHSRRKEREDWRERWVKAGGKFYNGKMIALKTDPVWTKLSVFGNPYPPFDWGSGMGVIDVDRKTAIELGLISDAELREETEKLRTAKSEASKFNDNLQATVSDKNGNELGRMRSLFGKEFGDLVKTEKIGDDIVLKWRPEVLRETLFKGNFTVKLGAPQENGMLTKLSEDKNCVIFTEQIQGTQLTVNQTWRDSKRRDGSNHLTHFFPEPNNPNNVPLTAEEVEMLPTLWRNPDRVRKLRRDIFEAQLDAFDGSIFVAQFKINITKEGFSPQLWTFYKKKSPKLL
jgi:hypothetical protein